MANFRHIARILSGKTEDEMRAQMSEISGHARLSLQGPVSRKSRKFSGVFRGDIILFVSSKRRRFEARNFAVIFIPFTTCEKISFT